LKLSNFKFKKHMGEIPNREPEEENPKQGERVELEKMKAEMLQELDRWRDEQLEKIHKETEEAERVLIEGARKKMDELEKEWMKSIREKFEK